MKVPGRIMICRVCGSCEGGACGLFKRKFLRLKIGCIGGCGVEEFEGRCLTEGNGCMFGVSKEWNINAVFSSGERDVELAQFFGFLILQSRLTFGALGLKKKPVFLMTDEIISPCITIDETEGKDDVEFKSFAHMDCHDGHRVRVGKGTSVNIFKGKEKFENFWEGGFCLGLVVEKDLAEFKIVGMRVKIGGGVEITEGLLQGL